MDHNGNGRNKSSMTTDGRFFTEIGKAAEDEMLKECELWEREAGDIRIPERAEAQILALARKYEKRQLNKKRDRYLRRFTKVAAAIAVLITLSFTVLFVTVDALRDKAFHFIIQNSDAYIRIIPVETSGPDADAKKNLPSGWTDVYYPDYLPKGYEFAEAEAAGEARTIAFRNTAGDVLLLTQEPSDGAEILMDNEGVESGEISVQGEPAFWTSKDGETTLMWNQYGCLFMLYGPVELEEMIRIAGRLQYVE